MTLIKLGEAINISPDDIEISSSVENDPEILKVLESFKKIAGELKILAPKAKDFLYFSAIMMTAAEASGLNPDGTVKVGSDGNPVQVGWDLSNDTWKWVSSDPSIMPYKNSNADIFPEFELIKAHKKWVGRPLCLDHKSSSVDFIRGVIVDTYYDRKNKRVIALCALDKINYPDLARKVSTGYATSVSMGTAVGRAICTTCSKVAKIESDFCNHMRERSCYGEINVDLTPIELSIVVNGADPQAKIKHIVAAANALSQYAEMKQRDINNITEDKINTNILASLKESVKDISDKLANLEVEVAKIPENEIKSSGITETREISLAEDLTSSSENLLTVIASVHTKLDKLQTDFDNLIKNKETNMATEKQAYFQGGGGANEPAPKTEKYPKEVDKHNEEDKHLNAQPTGPVDGMHPGYESFGESEEARKKRLQRMAEVDARTKMRTEAVAKAKKNLEKAGYYQGGEGVNEPTPGKPKYPKEDDKHNEEDKHLEGQPPFPGVGSVDGLHPSPASADVKDELKRKEMLSRAQLKAKFVKAANSDGTENHGASRWDVYAGDKLILTATVQELTGGKVAALYTSIATKDFGLKILDTIKTAGFEKAQSIYKGAQEMPVAPPMAAPAMPADLAPAPEAAPVDESEAGDPKDRAKELATKVRDASSDLMEAIDVLAGEQPELAGVDELGGQGNEINTASLQSMRKFLNASLLEGMKEKVAELKEHEEELALIEHIYNQTKVAKASSEDKSMVSSLTKDAFEHSNRVLADSQKLLAAFIKYANGTESLEQRIAEESKVVKAQAVLPLTPHDDIPVPSTTDVKPAQDAAKKLVKTLQEPSPSPEEMTKKVEDVINGHKADDMAMANDKDNKDEDKSDKNEVTVDLNPEQMKGMLEHKEATATEDLSTKEGRSARRAKLAQKGVEWNPIVKEFHPKGGFTTELTDSKPTGDLAKVETITEIHDKMLEVANAPPKVKKAAEDIQKAIVAGKLDVSDVDKLAKFGLDPAAIKYWKQFYGQSPDGGSEFASELIKEHAKAKLDDDKLAWQVKMARAYELAYEMADRDLIVREASVIKEQVEEIMKFNDANFESLKKVVSRHAPRGLTKEASIPQVGLLGGGDILMPRYEEEPSSLLSELEKAFSSGKRY